MPRLAAPLAALLSAPLFLSALLLLPAPAARPARAAEAAALAPPREAAVALTLYSDGRSWVRESATVSILRGEAALPWPRACSALEPDTLSARVVEGAARVIGVTPPRRLQDPAALLEQWIGREVDLVQVGEDLAEKVTRGVLVGLPGGQPLIRLRDSLWLAPPGSLRLPAAAGAPLPGPEPAFVHLSAAGGGKATIEVSYRTPGLAWSAAYRAVRSGDALDFEGWITVRNDTGTDFPRASVKLIAGEVKRRPEAAPEMGRQYADVLTLAEGTAAPAPVAREALGATHLYTLPGTADLPASGQTRRVWVSRGGLPARQRYRLESGQGASYGGESGAPPAHPFTILSVEEGAFDEPLPAGVVRLFERDASGDLQEVGEDAIVHLPAGAPFDLRTGRAFDILAERTQTEQRPAGARGADLACEIRLRNSGAKAATVEVREFFSGRWKIEESSHEARRLDARTAEFRVPVPVGSDAILTYRASVRY